MLASVIVVMSLRLLGLERCRAPCHILGHRRRGERHATRRDIADTGLTLGRFMQRIMPTA